MTDVSVLLLKVGRHVDKVEVMHLVQRLLPGFPPVRRTDAFNSLATRDAQVYLQIDPVAGGPGLARARVHLAAVDGGTQLVDLQVLRSVPGVSAGRLAKYIYVQETDVVAVAEKQMNDWYDAQHLPRLACVSGNVHAWRLRSPDASPRYYTCYELETPEVMQSEAWLAIPNTPWSGMARPTFVNTRRAMFERVCRLEA